MLQSPPQGGIYLYRFLLCQRRYYFVSCGSVFQNLQIYHLKICVTTLPLRENPEWKFLHSWHRFLSFLFWGRKCDSLSMKEILQSLLVQNSCHKISTKKLKIWKGNADRQTNMAKDDILCLRGFRHKCRFDKWENPQGRLSTSHW